MNQERELSISELSAGPLANIFRFLSLKDKSNLKCVSKSFAQVVEIDWNWCVLPEFRGDNARESYLLNRAARITLDYCEKLISRLSLGAKVNQQYLLENAAAPRGFFAWYERDTGQNIRESLDDKKNLHKLTMILRHHNDLDINEASQSSSTVLVDDVIIYHTLLFNAINKHCHINVIELLIEYDAKINMACLCEAIYDVSIFEYLILRMPVSFKDENTFNTIIKNIVSRKNYPSTSDDTLKIFSQCEALLTQYRVKHMNCQGSTQSDIENMSILSCELSSTL